ncbi:DNA repair protein XRCC1 isoform X2 [Bombyx mori]|uniref:BRCT domain-containing protein n=1 Tax=Bombyx mori TaxID=7091 RepID=A0A8R2QZZ4_BOMMO|nr:DNA repair protein XRCC1 isoform X2 [Bombyx mori]
MPRVKIDYVVSFSSEDPDHPANNLLALEVNKKKWLCCKGESSCSVVLQLAKAVQISSVYLGVHHAATVEVLVGRSEKPDEPFEVLVPSSVMLSPSESRRAEGVQRVRAWRGDQLAAAARGRRWDRLRVVCAQPYNRHCQFGLSFLHIDEPGDGPPPAPPRPLALDTFSSDEEEFKPGELFAKYYTQKDSPLKLGDDKTSSPASTESQIHKATSRALRNVPGDSPAASPGLSAAATLRQSKQNRPAGRRRSDSDGDARMHDEEDTRHHAKIDQTVNRHKGDKMTDDNSAGDPKEVQKNIDNISSRAKRVKRDDSAGTAPAPRGQLADVLRGVRFVLSGYQNPLRQELRREGVALGARWEPVWGPACTHLICAFPNTPKLQEVRRVAGGAVPAVRADWLRACRRARRRVPWRPYATEPHQRTAPPHAAETDESADTDEEVRDRGRAPSPPAGATGSRGGSGEPDVQFVCDERVKASLAVESDSDETDAGADSGAEHAIDDSKSLPAFFEGVTFAVEAGDTQLRARCWRYLRAYGGRVLQKSQLDEDSRVDYVVCDDGAAPRIKGRAVTAAWLWKCHQQRKLCPI